MGIDCYRQPIDWRQALKIGELDFPRAKELLAKFYDLQMQMDRMSRDSTLN